MADKYIVEWSDGQVIEATKINKMTNHKEIYDVAHPVGSIVSFDKEQKDENGKIMGNLSNGTWEQLEDNTFLATKGSYQRYNTSTKTTDTINAEAGKYYGSNTAITVSHNHGNTGSTNGTFDAYDRNADNPPHRSGFVTGKNVSNIGSWSTGGAEQKRVTWTLNHTHSVGNTGINGTSYNMPYYFACYIYRRIG